MANWISSKLRVAETFLQQIDQTAAESLGKNEKPQLDELNTQTLTSKIETVFTPLKDQLKKKSLPESNDFYTPSKKDSVVISDKQAQKLSFDGSSKVSSLTDSDWTQLLSTPERSKSGSGLGSISKLKPTNSGRSYTNGGASKGAKKLVELKKNQRSSGSISKDVQKVDIVSNNVVNEKRSSVDDFSGLRDTVKGNNVVLGNGKAKVREKEELRVGERSLKPDSDLQQVSVRVDEIADKSKGVGNHESIVGARDAIPTRESPGGSLSSDGTSGSDSDSDSEKERERKAERARKRERVIAERAAAKAVEVIKEQENVVARLEGEKQSLEKILEERAKQQAQEASELQMSMMETMDAVDLEKQRHNNTRMEVLARLTKLETANAYLAKTLATTQWNLEVENNQLAELRHQIELKSATQEDLRRRITKVQHSRSSPDQSESSKGIEFEKEILEAEYAFTSEKMAQLERKEKKLQEDIEKLQKEMEVPTDVEVELKRRLAQLINHLIQKQSQVEALSSEKATLLFRIETVSRLLEEEKSRSQLPEFAGPSLSEDLEAGTWDMSNGKLRPLFVDNIQSGSRHLGSLLRQLDSIFSAGAAFIRRNPSGKYLALFYLACLHFWVSYIFISHSQTSDPEFGAVVSLESINKTRGP